MESEYKYIRRWLKVFIAGLFISGLTTIPLEKELEFFCGVFPPGNFLGDWLDKVYTGIQATNKEYPFLSYGYDWLAFAHVVLAILFIGPLRNPVRNKWVIEFGIIACLLVIPFAIVAGQVRQIPFWWRLVDCSFGLIGLIPLGLCLQSINRIEDENENIPELSNNFLKK